MFNNKTLMKGLAGLLALIMCLPGMTGCVSCTYVPVEPHTTQSAVATEVPPTEAPTEEPVTRTVDLRQDIASVIAVETGTFGLASDGTVRFIGNAVSGQNYIYDWTDIREIAANDRTVAGLKEDGTVCVAWAEPDNPYSEAAEWTDVIGIAMGVNHIVGLVSDGTVLAAGDNALGQCDVSDWTGVIKVCAAAGYTAALTDNGIVTTLGETVDEVLNARPAADIAAGTECIAILDIDGTVRVYSLAGTSQKLGYSDWTDIVKVFIGGSSVYAVNRQGELLTDSELVTEPVTDAYFVSATNSHAVVLKGDGTVIGFGDGSDMKHGFEGWRLLPFVTEDGWLLGFGAGESYKGEELATGKTVVYTDPAAGTETEAVCVILGDVSGDGVIDQTDVDLVTAHIAGETALDGAFLRAANVIMDETEPDSVDVNDLDLITSEAGGRRAIDFYAKTDMYTAPLAEARRLNPDASGYITLAGTNISYPILYGDEWFYNDHGIDGKKSVQGCIYYYWSRANGNIVITGHNSRTSGTMFHELHNIQDNCAELSTYENRLWYINAYGESGWWEVWAMYEEGAFHKASDSSQYYNTGWPNTYNAMNEQERQEWIQYQLDRTELDYTVHVTTSDRFMTILTCGDSHSDAQRGARLYFFLRWVGRN